MRELFIYFKARLEHEAQIRQLLDLMQKILRDQHPGWVTRVLRRPEAIDGLHTWMEVYASNGTQGIEPGAQTAIAEAAQSLSPLIVGERHVEVFLVCGEG